MSYHELSVVERATIQIGLLNQWSQRRIARLLNRSPSTVSLVGRVKPARLPATPPTMV